MQGENSVWAVCGRSEGTAETNSVRAPERFQERKQKSFVIFIYKNHANPVSIRNGARLGEESFEAASSAAV
jgi:hypothetical protein